MYIINRVKGGGGAWRCNIVRDMQWVSGDGGGGGGLEGWLMR